MANNDRIILEQVVEEQRQGRLPSASKSEFFEIYVAEQVLKDFDLTDDEIGVGLVGAGGDGGTDGIYTFANGELVQEDFDYQPLKKNVLIEVVIVQSKISPSFTESALDKMTAFTRDVFDLARGLEDFKGVYNDSVLAAIANFRRLFTGIAGRFPKLRFRYVYATPGDAAQVHPNVSRKIDELRKAIAAHFSDGAFEFAFLGASELLHIARRQPATTYEVAVTDILSAKEGYIALVRLDELFKLVADDDGILRRMLFEANVRDYQGSTLVNEEIRNSLNERGLEDFWWLNNGITIVASKASLSSKVLLVEDPQIVNGQQTSTEIFNYFKQANTSGDDRSVMVRIVVVTDPASRDRIIKATNSQTAIPAASLRATDKIHRDIEQYLAPFGIYYDRRKGSQKNLGRPVEQIVGISLLAQSIMAICLQRPNDARARPSSLVKDDEDYKRLFSESYPIEIYLLAAKLIKGVRQRLRERGHLASKDQNNLLFYVAMDLAATLATTAAPLPKQVSAIKFEELTLTQVDASTDLVHKLYVDAGATDQVAKGSQLVAALKQSLADRYPGQEAQSSH